MSLANSRTRRAEPRTAADLAERGFKLVSIGRPRDWSGPTHDEHGRRTRQPMEYKLVRLDADDRTSHAAASYSRERHGKWFGIIKGRPSASTAHLPLAKGYGHSLRPMAGGPFESRVAAAHAILDKLGL